MKWKIFSLAMLVIACEYKPKDVHYVDLNKETYGNIAINLLDQPDTIILIQHTDCSYDIAIQEGQVIHNTEISVDDELISVTNNTKGTFTLVPTDFETGSHRLRIEVTTTSGTGSIADIGGAESLYYTREWVLITDHTPPESLEITSIAEFNGKLRIEWTKNNNQNFQHYIVYRNLYNPVNHSSNETGLARICDSDTNWFVDDSYVGGLVTYHIENTGMNITASGIHRSYNGSYPKFLSVKKKDGDIMTYIWNKTRFQDNFAKYEVSSRDKTNYTFTNLFSTENANDTSYTHTISFGDSVDIWLNTVPQGVDYWYPETMSDRISVYAGEKVPRFYSGLVHSNDPDIVYLVDYNYIKRFNLKTGTAEHTLETDYNDWEYPHVFISPDGKYLVRASGNMAYLLDPINLTTIKTINLSQFFSSTNALRYTAVTNQGWLSVSMDEWPYVAGIINLSTSDTVFTMKGYNHITIYPSSYNTYMIIRSSETALYRYEDGLTKLHNLDSRDIFEFNPLNEEEVYSFSRISNSVNILKCSDLQVVKTCNTAMAASDHDLDPITGLIMFYGQYEAYIWDMDQNKIVNTKKLEFSTYFNRVYSYFNNALFSGLGYKLSLNQ